MVTDADSWSKIFIWTQIVYLVGSGRPYFHCLRRNGDFLRWYLPPNYTTADDYLKSDFSPCSAFYIYRFRPGTDDPMAVNENRICTADDWCLSGKSLSNPDLLGHGAVHPRSSAELAVRFEASQPELGTVTAQVNTLADYPVNVDGWACIKKLLSYGPYDEDGESENAKTLSLAADPNDCAELIVAWLE